LLTIVGVVVVVLVLGAGWLTGLFGEAYWWLTNTTPPTLVLAGPPAVVRGPITIGSQVGPRARIVDAQVDDRPLDVEQGLVVDTAALPDGVHRVRVTAQDSSWRHNQQQAEVQIRSDNTAPKLTLTPDPATAQQGHTWLLRVQTDEQATVRVTLDGKPLDLQGADGFGWLILGIGPDDEPKTREIVVSGIDQAGNASEQRLSLPIAKTQWTQDTVQVGPDLMPLLAPQVRSDEDAQLAKTYAGFSPERLWNGKFVMPTPGQIMTQFGEVRSYNGGPFEGHHGGADIAAPMGQAVRAPARARVALIDKVKLRGNVVILDHGQGVYTTYGHLSAVNVKVGDEVEAGQVFANVGTTGLSEGPHLHWELWVRGANVDPLDWVKRSYP
jgi:murein DD-endopeptidase MepM/ murein hydrolase activator NlpD